MAVRITNILGPDGEYVEVETLQREIAAPTMGGVRNILNGNPTAGLDPARLARILRAAVEGEAEAYYALAEEMEEKYLHYQGVLATRKRAVTQLEITVEAASDSAEHQKHAQLIRDFLNRDELDGETFDIMDALGKGFSATEMVWETDKTPWLPCLKTRSQNFFQLDREDGETLRLRGGLDGMSALDADLPPYKFIIHRSSGKTGLTVRGGLARSVAWAYLFQNMALKDWVIFAEVYGMPIRLGKYDANATEEDRRKLLRAVIGIATDAAAIIPKSMEVEFTNGMASGNPDVYKQLCEYLDQQVSKLVVGQTATTDATAGGLGGSQGNVHNDVREDIQRADAKALSATLNRDLVRPCIDFNFGQPIDGLYPRVKIGQAETFTKEDMDLVGAFVDRGGKVGISVIRDKMGIPDPAKDEELLTAAASKAAPPAGGNTGPGATDPAMAANSAVLAVLNRLKAGSGGRPGPTIAADAIDGLVDDLSSQWVEVMAPMIDPIETLAAGATSYDDLKTRLIQAMSAMDPQKLAASLAIGQFNARLAGEAGIDIRGGVPDAG